ncbi:hypothetical protein [Streptococcus plurextorum]|uniref:hypothetical protein n=1 Tax=Streptococcus plurextorum TaxID=456876 RepID=UPI0012EC4EA2|nr:hypothetical protein [Streptococcus plurextorum]
MKITDQQNNHLADQSYWVDKEKMMLNLIQKRENSIILFLFYFKTQIPSGVIK